MSSQNLQYLQAGRLHKLSGQPVPVFDLTCSKHTLMKFPVLQFVPTASCPPTGHHWEEPGSVPFTPCPPSSIYTHRQDSSEPSLLQIKQFQLPQTHLTQQTPQLHVPCSAEPSTGPSTPDVCLTSAEQQGRTTSLDLLITLCPAQPRRLLAAFPTRAHCWLVVSLVCSKDTCAKPLWSWAVPSLHWCMGLLLPTCRTLHFSIELCEIAVGPFLRPVEVPLKGSTTIWCTSCFSDLCITWKLAEVHSFPPARQ